MTALRGRSVRSVGWVLALALALGAGPWRVEDALAEVQQVEAIGSVPIRPGSGAAPREAALDQALREAVMRAARELLLDVELPGDAEEDPDAALFEILGKDMLRYASRFRILEDRGERPALFTDDPRVTSEYVLVVEVHVDIDRLKLQLVEVGLLAGSEPPERGRQLRVAFEGIGSYPAYQAIRHLLLEEVGAKSALPVEFEGQRAVLAVEWEDDPERLFDRLRDRAPDQLAIRLVRAGRNSLELEVRWTGPIEAAQPADVEAGPGPASRGASRN